MNQIKTITLSLVAIFILQACSFTRTMLHWKPNITDHKIFNHTELLPGNEVFKFKQGIMNDSTRNAIDAFLKGSSTTAFLVIRNDSILYERYFKGYTRESISSVFSISKSITSLLTGIAVEEGYIKSVHDPVTLYVPELKKEDPRFERLTIEHLLNMRAGFKFNEDNLVPFSKATNLYYGTDHLAVIKRARFKHEPGEVYEYQSLSTALLGVVVERAIGKNLSDYLQEKVWTTIGMENRATWSIDNKRNRSAKGHVGVNATAIDLAKIGRLYLNNGNWNGKQIVSSSWVSKSATPDVTNEGYQYKWWGFKVWLSSPERTSIAKNGYAYFPDSLSASKFIEEKYPQNKFFSVSANNKERTQWIAKMYHPNLYSAQGILDQYLFVNPTTNTIVVRLGEEDKKKQYEYFIYNLIGDSFL